MSGLVADWAVADGSGRTAAQRHRSVPGGAGGGFAGSPQVRPCRLSRGIHAAHSPANPPPAPPRMLRRCAWGPMAGRGRSRWLGCRGCARPFFVGEEQPGRARLYRGKPYRERRIVAPGSARPPGEEAPGAARHPNDRDLPRPADGPYAHRRTVGAPPGVGLRGAEPHGCGDAAYKDVLAATPQTHTGRSPDRRHHRRAAVRQKPTASRAEPGSTQQSAARTKQQPTKNPAQGRVSR